MPEALALTGITAATALLYFNPQVHATIKTLAISVVAALGVTYASSTVAVEQSYGDHTGHGHETGMTCCLGCTADQFFGTNMCGVCK